MASRAAFEKCDVSAYSGAVFGMFGGESEAVTLRVSNRLAGVVLDRFGCDLLLLPDGEEHFRIHVRVAVSPNFFGWVFGFGDGMAILAPDAVKQKFCEHIKRVKNLYE